MTTEQTIDLGDDHRITLITPDGGDHPVSADVYHLTPDGQPCVGWIPFDVPGAMRRTEMWSVESWEPLTLSPSLLCGCGDHGFVRSGAWVRA